MTIDERQRNFKAAKQEAKQQQAAEAEQEQSSVHERNIRAMEEYVANKQLTDILKGIEKHTKKMESIQADIEDSLRIINEKLILLLGGFAIIIITAVGFAAYRYFMR